ncbi:hypothetical protein Z043_113019 [Scleropages formosus]|uniref:exodeoxyribonuclease III n=1 Tax=Scleropages formosus TaxID=113540 RepID=A0A0P7V1V3_SCLFO|nr:hypothetical protein Z043_113019 [Scleropages formosus]
MYVPTCDIVQMSAVCGDASFNVHMLPRRRMSPQASRRALITFVDFVRSFSRPVLVAHNAFRFDAPVLARALREFCLQSEMEHVLSGFLDTFLLSKELLGPTGIRKYSQEYLVEHFLKKSYRAHNALEDVKALQELFHHWNPAPSIIRRHIFTMAQLDDPFFALPYLGPRHRPGCDIVQLAAVSGGHSFNLYMVPRCRIQKGPSALTGLRVRRHRLFFRTRPVPTSTHQEALTAFLAFLRMLGRPLLVGHSIRRFDCPVLEKFRLNGEFHQATAGFLDTLPLAQDLLRGQGLRSFWQESLVKAVLGIRYPGHDALEDVRALQRLYAALGPTPEQVRKSTPSGWTAMH